MTSAVALIALSTSVRAQGAAVPPQARPLAPFAGRHVIVLPTQFLRAGDSLGWAAQAGEPRDYLATMDAEIAFALGQRGLDRAWVFPDRVAASAKRNAPYAPDPYAISAGWLRAPGPKKNPEQLFEPLASQLRSVAAFQEDVRYVLLPVEIRFEPIGNGIGHALLRAVLVDTRLNRLVWEADVMSDPEPKFSPALAASLAGHLADLIAEPGS